LSTCIAKTVLLRAPAKLNFGLEIVGIRPNGFHELQSLFWPITLGDDIQLEPSPTIGVTGAWENDAPRPRPPVPQNEENLVYRAIELAGGGWKASIRKNIPMGAGLGGGSSDAGTVLGHLSPAIDVDQAAKIGADVPFFLKPVPTWVEGIGETRFPLPGPYPDLCLLLIFPPEELATPKVFKTYRENRPTYSARRKPNWQNGKNPLLEYLGTAKNDLTDSAVKLYPLLGEILRNLEQTGPIFTSMTGSGSTCFAVYKSPTDREESAKVLQSFLRLNNCKGLFAGTYREAIPD